MAMKGSTEWTPMYLLIVLAIAAVLLITFVKPLFRQASVASDLNAQDARRALGAISFLVFALPLLKRRSV